MAVVVGLDDDGFVWVVRGLGTAERRPAGTTTVAEFKEGRVVEFKVEPEDAGIRRATIEQLKGGEPAHNAALMRDLLGGSTGPLRDVVLLNTAASLIVAGRATSLRQGAELAARSIDSGAARGVLERLIAATNSKAA